jgi:thiamine-phosphate pyrophosphorylase
MGFIEMEMSNVPVYRILDANLDRAREGLRVVEEWCRFGLNNIELAGLCKQLRQELGSWHRHEFRLARDTPADVGTEITHIREEARANVTDVLRANLSRVQEALRVLEEYGKVYSSAMGLACKHMRYQVYTLESQLLLQERKQRLQDTTLYLITSPSDTLDETVEVALQGGVRLVQYRDKDPDDAARLTRARSLRSLCQRYRALFIVNDRVDLALAADADGVHLGQQDLPVEAARQLLGSYRLIGRSTTSPTELKRAMEEDIDYIGVGPVFATPTKADKAVAGLDYVRYAAAHSTLPWFAIGGIDRQNLPQVIQAGAQRVAIARAIMQAADPSSAVRQALASLQSLQ